MNNIYIYIHACVCRRCYSSWQCISTRRERERARSWEKSGLMPSINWMCVMVSEPHLKHSLPLPLCSFEGVMKVNNYVWVMRTQRFIADTAIIHTQQIYGSSNSKHHMCPSHPQKQNSHTHTNRTKSFMCFVSILPLTSGKDWKGYTFRMRLRMRSLVNLQFLHDRTWWLKTFSRL